MTILLTYLPFLIALMVLLVFVQIELKGMEKKIKSVAGARQKSHEILSDSIRSLCQDRDRNHAEFLDYCGHNGAALAQLSENLKAAKSQSYEEFMCNSGGIAELTDRLVALERKANEKPMKCLKKAMGKKNAKR